MKGYFRRRGCTCGKKKCTCGAKWSFTIDVGIDPSTGKRRQRTVSGFPTKAEAEEAATNLHYKLTQGTYIEEKNILFKDFAEKWLELYKATGKIKITTITLRESKKRKILEYFSGIQIKRISKTMYQDMLNDLSKKLSRKTVTSIHETGSLIFKKALELEVIQSDPTVYATVPVLQKTIEQLENETEIPKYLEKEELAIFLKVAQLRSHHYVLFLLMAYTGMRVGEVCALKWRDIDFEEKKVSINKNIYSKRVTDYVLQTPKNKQSRTIDIDDLVLSALEDHRAAQNLTRMRYRKTYVDEGFVFAREDRYHGYPEDITRVNTYMTSVLKLAGLNENLTSHSFRHTHTSLLAEAGVGLEVIMERLGHKSDKVTRNIYLHVTKTQKKEASQKFAELMKSL